MELDECLKKLLKELEHRREGLARYRQVLDDRHLVPDAYLTDDRKMNTQQDCLQLLSQLRGVVNQKRESNRAIEIRRCQLQSELQASECFPLQHNAGDGC